MSRRKINLEKLANLYPPVAIYNAATGGSEGRKARRAARQERIRKRQAAKTARMEQRQAARLSRAEQRQEARAQRKAVRQQARLGKLAERKQLSEQMENLGAVAEAQKAGGAIREATTNAKMRAYVENQGGEIEEGAEPEEIAAQAEELREEEIVDTQDALNEDLEEGEEPYSYDEAENYLFDMYDAESFDGDDVNNYDPLTAAAVKAASKKGLEIISKKRAKQGKKTLGMTPEELEKLLKPNYAPTKDPTTDIGKIVAEGKKAYIDETAETSSDYIIVIVGVLIVIGVYIGLRNRNS